MKGRGTAVDGNGVLACEFFAECLLKLRDGRPQGQLRGIEDGHDGIDVGLGDFGPGQRDLSRLRHI